MNADSVAAIESFTPNLKPYGLTFGQWTVRWWQWAHGSPRGLNPVLDQTGVNASINQSGPVWFLAGTFGENNIAKRRCTLPFGKAILFPVINYEMNELENPRIRAGRDLIKHVLQDIDDIVVKQAIVDGKDVPIYRIQSDPSIFDLNIASDNCMGIRGGSTKAAADGYWVFLKPLDLGQHTIYFYGSCSGGTRNAAAEYQINVVHHT